MQPGTKVEAINRGAWRNRKAVVDVRREKSLLRDSDICGRAAAIVLPRRAPLRGGSSFISSVSYASAATIWLCKVSGCRQIRDRRSLQPQHFGTAFNNSLEQFLESYSPSSAIGIGLAVLELAFPSTVGEILMLVSSISAKRAARYLLFG
jgi:hypothetical protein